MIEIIPNFHPIFVHFTIALFSTCFLLFMAGSFFRTHQWSETMLKAAHVNLWIGSIFTIFTLLAGWDAYNTVTHDGPSHAAMTDHRNWALVTAVVWGGLATWSLKFHRKIARVTVPFLGVLIIAWGLLMTTGFKGGEAVYRYGLGVMSMPQVMDDGSHGSHTHSGGMEDGASMPSHHNNSGMKGGNNHDSTPHEH